MSFNIVPYVQVDGRWSFSDSFMKDVFNRLHDQGIVLYLFYGGEVKTDEDFLIFIKNGKNLAHIILDETQPALIAWLNNFGRNYAYIHYAMFKEYWGKSTRELGYMALQYWFDFKKDGKPLFDILLGGTPSNNRMATRFLRKMNMTILGNIPGIAWDAYKNEYSDLIVSYIKREDLKNG